MSNLPGLTNNERKAFLGIKLGKITYRPGKDAEPETYDNLSGVLKSITKREATINDTSMLFYDFIMENSGKIFDLSIPVGSGVARSIILSLASIKDFNGQTIRISPYLKDGKYTNVSVYSNGERQHWVCEPNEVPAVKKINTGSKELTDDSDRIAFVESWVNVINERLQRVVDEETGEMQGPVVDIESEDMPEEIG